MKQILSRQPVFGEGVLSLMAQVGGSKMHFLTLLYHLTRQGEEK